LQKRIAFFKEAVKNIKTSGSVMPSSRFLVKKMLENINFNQDLILVEFGPANGIITSAIIEKMSAKSKLVCFEINPVFYAELTKNIKDERVVILNESAENVKDALQKLNIQKMDYCISSLPLAMIPKQVCNRILKNTLSALKEDGLFVQYQYSLQFHKHLKNIFNQKNIRLNFVLLNFPPAFVYNCQKK